MARRRAGGIRRWQSTCDQRRVAAETVPRHDKIDEGERDDGLIASERDGAIEVSRSGKRVANRFVRKALSSRRTSTGRPSGGGQGRTDVRSSPWVEARVRPACRGLASPTNEGYDRAGRIGRGCGDPGVRLPFSLVGRPANQFMTPPDVIEPIAASPRRDRCSRRAKSRRRTRGWRRSSGRCRIALEQGDDDWVPPGPEPALSHPGPRDPRHRGRLRARTRVRRHLDPGVPTLTRFGQAMWPRPTPPYSPVANAHSS